MTNLLSAALARQALARDSSSVENAGRLTEADALVAAIHEAYAPYSQQVQDLMLKVDDEAAIRFGDRKHQECAVECASGLAFVLGSAKTWDMLTVKVRRRIPGRPLCITIDYEQARFPFDRERFGYFPADVPLDQVLRACFEALAMHAHMPAEQTVEPTQVD